MQNEKLSESRHGADFRHFSVRRRALNRDEARVREHNSAHYSQHEAALRSAIAHEAAGAAPIQWAGAPPIQCGRMRTRRASGGRKPEPAVRGGYRTRHPAGAAPRRFRVHGRRRSPRSPQRDLAPHCFPRHPARVREGMDLRHRGWASPAPNSPSSAGRSARAGRRYAGSDRPAGTTRRGA